MKKIKKVTVSLPMTDVERLREISKLAGCSLNTTVNVILALQLVKRK